MFLVIFAIDSVDDLYLYFWTDPRPQGCKLPVIEGAELHGLPETDEEWWSIDDPEPAESQSFVLGAVAPDAETIQAFRPELDVPMEWDILTNPVEASATGKRGSGRWRGRSSGRRLSYHLRLTAVNSIPQRSKRVPLDRTPTRGYRTRFRSVFRRSLRELARI